MESELNEVFNIMKYRILNITDEMLIKLRLIDYALSGEIKYSDQPTGDLSDIDRLGNGLPAFPETFKRHYKIKKIVLTYPHFLFHNSFTGYLNDVYSLFLHPI